MVKIARKSVVYTVALGVGCIILGVVTGIAIERNNIKRKLLQHHVLKQKMTEQFRSQAGKQIGQKLLGALKEKLQLTQEQTVQIANIIKGSFEKIKNLQEKNKIVITQIKEETNNQILVTLDAEQQEKFKKLLEEKEKRKQQRRKHHQGFGDMKPPRY